MSEEVRQMFAEIAGKYDTANTVLSFGVHHYWRYLTVKRSGAKAGHHILDCATGTGDLAIAFKKKVGDEGYVLGTDFCAEMLAYAPDKSVSKGLVVDFEVADAMNLPYEDHRFDISSISFGIRNVDDPKKALEEMARVTKPGGKVVVLEFGQPSGPIGIPFEFYSKYVMPKLGGLVTGNQDAYTYLPETSARFPCGEEFISIMEATKAFRHMNYEKLTGGIAFLYIGEVA